MLKNLNEAASKLRYAYNNNEWHLVAAAFELIFGEPIVLEEAIISTKPLKITKLTKKKENPGKPAGKLAKALEKAEKEVIDYPIVKSVKKTGKPIAKAVEKPKVNKLEVGESGRAVKFPGNSFHDNGKTFLQDAEIDKKIKKGERTERRQAVFVDMTCCKCGKTEKVRGSYAMMFSRDNDENSILPGYTCTRH